MIQYIITGFIIITDRGHRFDVGDCDDIFEKLKSHADRWREIGGGLGFTKGEMDTIENTEVLALQGPSAFLEELLALWVPWAPGDGRGSTGYATKESLIAALLKANLGELAMKCMSWLHIMLKIRNDCQCYEFSCCYVLL